MEFKEVKKGWEVQFVDSNKKILTALVTSVEEKTFYVETLYFVESTKNWETKKMYWYKSGKNVNRFHNWGNAIKVVNKWNN